MDAINDNLNPDKLKDVLLADTTSLIKAYPGDPKAVHAALVAAAAIVEQNNRDKVAPLVNFAIDFSSGPEYECDPVWEWFLDAWNNGEN